MTGLEVKGNLDGTLAVLHLRGEARLETVHRLEEEASGALDSGAQDFILDLTYLNFMDSASAGTLLRLESKVTGQGGKLVLCGLQRMVQRLMERAGLKERFPCAADVKGARSLIMPDA